MARKDGKISTFRDLIVWQKGMDLTRAIYRATDGMPRREIFGLTNQMRRAAYSVPLNIAEGYGQHTRPKFIHGLRTAMGSLMEVMTAYEIATSLNMIAADQQLLDLLSEEDRLLQSLIMKLEAKEQTEDRSSHRRRGGPKPQN
jgi:four helix bundle protein